MVMVIRSKRLILNPDNAMSVCLQLDAYLFFMAVVLSSIHSFCRVRRRGLEVASNVAPLSFSLCFLFLSPFCWLQSSYIRVHRCSDFVVSCWCCDFDSCRPSRSGTSLTVSWLKAQTLSVFKHHSHNVTQILLTILFEDIQVAYKLDIFASSEGGLYVMVPYLRSVHFFRFSAFIEFEEADWCWLMLINADW